MSNNDSVSLVEQTVMSFIMDYFLQKGEIPGQTAASRLECDYVQSGLIDSFGILELISAVEHAFPIRFDSDDFENPAFKTVGGLASIISKKLK